MHFRLNSHNNSHLRFDDNPPEPVSSADGDILVSSAHNHQQLRDQSFDPVSSSSASSSIFSSVRILQASHRLNNHHDTLEPPREPFNLVFQENNPELPLPSCSLSQNAHLSDELGADVPLEPCQGFYFCKIILF